MGIPRRHTPARLCNRHGGSRCCSLLQWSKAGSDQPTSTPRTTGRGLAARMSIATRAVTDKLEVLIFLHHWCQQNIEWYIYIVLWRHCYVSRCQWVNEGKKTCFQITWSLAKGPFSAVGSRVLRLAGLRCRVLYPAQPNGKEAPYLSEGRQTSEARLHLEFGINKSVRLKMPWTKTIIFLGGVQWWLAPYRTWSGFPPWTWCWQHNHQWLQGCYGRLSVFSWLLIGALGCCDFGMLGGQLPVPAVQQLKN